jgi:transposase
MPNPATARAYLTALIADLTTEDRHTQLHSLAKTLTTWYDPILAWHTTHATAGPTEGQNNLIKATKRVGFGFRSLHN